MPYIPRRTPNGVGPPSELLAAIKQPQAQETAKPRRKDATLELPTLSMAKWDVPPEKIYRNIFGTEPKRDEHTGELVYPRFGYQSAGGGETNAAGTAHFGQQPLQSGLPPAHDHGHDPRPAHSPFRSPFADRRT